MCVLGQPEPVGSVLTFHSGYDTLEYSWVKATAVSVRLRILFLTLQNSNMLSFFPQNFAVVRHLCLSQITTVHAQPFKNRHREHSPLLARFVVLC